MNLLNKGKVCVVGVGLSEGSMKEMAELLRKGATMLGESCPECSTPLFKLKNGDILCPMCNRPVKFVEANEDPEIRVQQGSLESTLRSKIKEVQTLLDKENNPEKIREIVSTLMVLLEAMDKVKKLS